MLNEMTNKTKLALTNLAIGAMLAPSMVYADGNGLDITVGNDGSVSFGSGSQSLTDTGSSLKTTTISILGWVTAIGIVITVICLVVAGVFYATSMGNPQKRVQARSAITGCLIGAAVIGGASMLAGVAYGILR